MESSLTEMAAKIVAAQAGHHAMTHDQVMAALKSVHSSLCNIKHMEDGDEGGSIVDVPDHLAELRKHPKKSIRQNSITCLECGAEFKQISSKHTLTHEMTLKEYKKKWGLKGKIALSSKALSAKRRENAERLGMKDRLAIAREARFGKKVAAPLPESENQVAKDIAEKPEPKEPEASVE